MPTLELNGKPFAEQTGTGEPVLKGNLNFEGPIRINNQEVLSANGSIRLTVDEISEKTQGGGITLSHSLKNSSGAEIISPSGTVSNLTKLSLTPSSAPSSPIQGDIYLDSSDNQLKIYSGTVWKNILSGEGIVATGGTVTDITDGGINYRVHTFTTSGTFQVLSGSGEVEYLVIAGGGGGGGYIGGGGGAGGYRSSVSGESSGGGTSAESAITLNPGSYAVTIGAGGTGWSSSFEGPGGKGVNSSFSTITSLGGGGGRGGGDTTGYSNGGSGGGGGHDGADPAGSGTSGQGYDGGSLGVRTPPYYNGGGGGGAGQIGQTATSAVGGAGGAGVQSFINGVATYRAGGGGGGYYNGFSPAGGENPSSGGIGGGGNGGNNSVSSAGTDNTGGGGGTSKNGGSGIVIIRYQI